MIEMDHKSTCAYCGKVTARESCVVAMIYNGKPCEECVVKFKKSSLHGAAYKRHDGGGWDDSFEYRMLNTKGGNDD